MTYKEFIQNIINTRGQWNIPEGQYWEGHHIKPKCMGGKGNTRRKDPNVIWLLLAEHIEAHRLLALEHPDNRKLVYAYECMSKMKDVEAEAAKRYEMYHNPKNKVKKKHDAICKKPDFREKISKSLSKYRQENGFSEEHLDKIRESSEKRKEEMHEKGLNFYGTKIRAEDECGQNQQFATRSKPIKCTILATDQTYYFKSIRAGAIWWHKHYPLKNKFSECIYQRKIKQSIRGVQPQYKDAIIDYIKWEEVIDDNKDKN